MKILAVSDVEDNTLENLIDADIGRFKSVNCIFSCGDLAKKYLEYVTDSLQKSLYFVSGNHFTSQFYNENFNSPEMQKKLYYGKGMRHRAGGIDMHGRVEVLDNYIIVGFGGSMRYNPGNFQFEEQEMEKIVKRAVSAVWNQRIIDFLMLRRKKEIIVMSHAPVKGVHDKEDACHSGFESFRQFVLKMKPLLWLHGHIHIEGARKQQQSVLGETLIVNVYASKIINLNGKKIEIKQVFE